MKTVIPTEYFTSKDKSINLLFFKKRVPDFRDTFRFFYFGQDANSIQKAEQASIFRGTFRNLEKI
jgi:hypothetical protein